MKDNYKNIRWHQRFENFEKAFKQLKNAVSLKKYSELETAGLIQIFEFTFELSWKCLKDYLESEGFNVKSPRDSIKQAFQINILEDGKIWLDALEKRNILTHTYDEKTSKLAISLIKDKYFDIIEKLYLKLESLK